MLAITKQHRFTYNYDKIITFLLHFYKKMCHTKRHLKVGLLSECQQDLIYCKYKNADLPQVVQQQYTASSVQHC